MSALGGKADSDQQLLTKVHRVVPNAGPVPKCPSRNHFAKFQARTLKAEPHRNPASGALCAFGDQTWDQISKQAAKPWLSRARNGEGGIRTPRYGYPYNGFSSSKVLILMRAVR